MDLIEKWLSGTKNFAVGRVLYQRFGKDAALKALFATGKTHASQQALEVELRKLIAVQEKVAPDVSDTVVEVKLLDASHAITHKAVDSDPVLKSIRAEWLPFYQLMNKKRHDLHLQGAANNMDAISYRKALAFEILELERKVNQLWAKADFYKLNGKLPDVKPVEPDIPNEPVAFATFISNVERNIRRNRLLIERCPDKPLYVQKYAEYKALYKKATGDEYKEVKND